MSQYTDESYPPEIYESAPVAATSAIGSAAGGSWNPSGSTPPSSLANLAAGIPVPVSAIPATAWTTEYVQGPGYRAAWDGAGWITHAVSDARSEPESEEGPDIAPDPPESASEA